MVKQIPSMAQKELCRTVYQIGSLKSLLLIGRGMRFHQNLTEVQDATEWRHHVMRDRSYKHFNSSTVLLLALQLMLHSDILESE